jgi:hypothetical protein
MEKQEFYYWIDTKVSIWNRSKYTVNASSREEADEIMKKEFHNQEYPENEDVMFIECETLYDTESPLTPEVDAPTKELILEDTGETIENNEP